jgi:hypothetical protein
MQALVEFTVRSGIGFSIFENDVTKSPESSVPVRDILVRIRMRIRILGSVPLANGSGCGSAPKSFVTLRMQKYIFFVSYF